MGFRVKIFECLGAGIQGIIQGIFHGVFLSVFFMSFFSYGEKQAPMATASLSGSSIKIAYFSSREKNSFEKEVRPFFLEQARHCPSCEIVDMTPYGEQGLIDYQKLPQVLEGATLSDAQILVFDFNLPLGDQTKNIEELLEKRVAAGSFVVSTTGKKVDNQKIYPLSRTLFGKNDKFIVVGERDKRDRIQLETHFGPEMLTALRTPTGYEGKDLAPVLFAAKWASNWSRKKPDAWLEYFKTKKEKNRRLWLDLESLFPW